MKKNISILVCLLIAWIVNGQSNNVGINTDNPQRKLHVEGNLRVRNLKEKGGDSQYNRILVTNADGDIDYITRSSLVPDTSGTDSGKNVYNQNHQTPTAFPDNTKLVKCGKYEFSIRNITADDSQSSVSVRYVTVPTSPVTSHYTFVQQYPIDGYQIISNDATTFTIGTDNIFQQLGGRLADSEINTLYVNSPDEADMYKVFFYRMRNSAFSAPRNWTISCEIY